MFDRVLVLAPHTDDGEFGCGATIRRFVEEGKEVHYIAFSACEDMVPDPWPRDVLRKEVQEATKVLGIPRENLRVLDFPGRMLPHHRQEILDYLIQIRSEIQPDLILQPCLEDMHQDHGTVAMESLRAFKHYTVLGYEVPWNIIHFEAICFFIMEERYLSCKLEALKCYKSQEYRPYSQPDFIRSWARTRGTQVNAEYAEAFEVIRWVMR